MVHERQLQGYNHYLPSRSKFWSRPCLSASLKALLECFERGGGVDNVTAAWTDLTVFADMLTCMV